MQIKPGEYFFAAAQQTALPMGYRVQSGALRAVFWC
jgi:hypothetical protein